MSMPSGTPGQRPDGEVGAETEADARERERRTQAQQARPRMNVQQIHSWVDLEIEQALRRGEFDNLPGAGKPIKNLEQNDPDWWVKGLIEREKLDLSSALPTVMALRQERRGFPESLAGISDEVAVRERLEDYNQRVLEDRRKPVVGPNPPAVAGRVDVDEMVAQWRQLRIDRERRVSAGPATVQASEPSVEQGRTGWSVSRTAAAVAVVLIVLVVLLWVVL
ncbi:DUF1992 domain-containing protein [Ornithinimicrobium sp. F0845]|uniref:DnaJ family domain-containing protein n=1 Tax=Ornithinimicrobium sp. F0845 TaxID=2926412 RepID=UPI001FF23245|nr:DUF1992 domain-containing protein [Ornithinimicrobium sp. F0845]MCK0111842.1 DUF1992 domain-containing protein [Ornithinimicrobium sp. F0845]